MGGGGRGGYRPAAGEPGAREGLEPSNSATWGPGSCGLGGFGRHKKVQGAWLRAPGAREMRAQGAPDGQGRTGAKT